MNKATGGGGVPTCLTSRDVTRAGKHVHSRGEGRLEAPEHPQIRAGPRAKQTWLQTRCAHLNFKIPDLDCGAIQSRPHRLA